MLSELIGVSAPYLFLLISRLFFVRFSMSSLLKYFSLSQKNKEEKQRPTSACLHDFRGSLRWPLVAARCQCSPGCLGSAGDPGEAGEDLFRGGTWG